MNVSSFTTIFGLSVLALLQIAASVVLLCWAWPLFADPPVLGTGISSAANQLREIAEAHPDEFKHISWVPAHLRSSFYTLQEGILIALGAAISFVISAAALLFIALLHILEIRRHAQQST